MTRASLENANGRNVNLSGANLYNSYLSYANLSGANLTNAYLGWANLTYTKLVSANLFHANFANALLRETYIRSAKNLEEADNVDGTLSDLKRRYVVTIPTYPVQNGGGCDYDCLYGDDPEPPAPGIGNDSENDYGFDDGPCIGDCNDMDGDGRTWDDFDADGDGLYER
jgi:hypothetical protein